MSLLININAAGLQLKLIFIQKETPALMFFWQLSEIVNNNFFNTNLEKSIVIRNKDQISIANLIMQLLILNFAEISVFQAVATGYIKSYQSKKITKIRK